MLSEHCFLWPHNTSSIATGHPCLSTALPGLFIFIFCYPSSFSKLFSSRGPADSPGGHKAPCSQGPRETPLPADVCAAVREAQAEARPQLPGAVCHLPAASGRFQLLPDGRVPGNFRGERTLLIKSDHILPSLQGPHDFRAARVCPLDLCAQHPSGVTRCPAEPLAQGCLTATRSAEWREPCQGADPVDGGDPQLTEGS